MAEEVEQWQYFVQPVGSDEADSESLEGHLDDLGEDGWELVAVQPASDGGFLLFLKRPGTDDEEEEEG